MMAERHQPAADSSTAAILALPKDVVDKIAAGEVVQRPCSVVKELLENALDADSTNIVVHVQGGGLQKLQLTDNGCGISKTDLNMAATRFATSKFRTLDDFHTLQSFGFRGEALASVSLVARLQIVSRTKDGNVGYVQSYANGGPVETPRPQARTTGTTVTVQDLFYNLPHRRKLNGSDEYWRILTVVQHYAIHAAHRGVGMVCRKVTGKKNAVVVDLNSTTLVSNDNDDVSSAIGSIAATKRVMGHVFGSTLESNLIEMQCEIAPTEDKEEPVFRYAAKGLVSHPSYSAPKAVLILFVNHRLVDCPPLKRAVEEVCSQFSNNKPVLYLSLLVPGTQVDVNVHPTKQQVALLYQDELIASVAAELRSVLSSQDQSFANSSVKPPDNPYTKKRKSNSKDSPTSSSTMTSAAKALEETPQTQKRPKPTPPSSMIRTTKAAPAGALEPYLVSTDKKSKSPQETQHHVPDCPRRDGLDLSVPGAFVHARCDCPMVRTVRRSVARPRKAVPADCMYKSILSLRRKIEKRQCPALTKQLRDSIFVGQLSSQRCLVQCSIELHMWNVRTMAQALFYQLALTRFGEMVPAKMETPIDVTRVMSHALELEECLEEDDPQVTEVSETNHELAQQAATCLLEQAEMLDEYFSIGVERIDDCIVLTSLPVLLDDYEPSPGGVPFFLLRLATEVDWSEEKPCFQGVCRELGIYYAQTTSDVKHTLFPAISYLLAPSKTLLEDGTVSRLTNIPSLYKVFERC